VGVAIIVRVEALQMPFDATLPSLGHVIARRIHVIFFAINRVDKRTENNGAGGQHETASCGGRCHREETLL